MIFKITAFIFFLSSVCWAGKDMGNGGGLAEKYVLHAYLNLGSYIDMCFHSRVCGITQEEKDILKEIRDSLKLEHQKTDQIEFHSEKAEKGFFMIDGLVRIAKTGKSIGDKIYVNSDQLYSDKGESITLGMAVVTLVHEFGHHHNIADHTKLDLLGMKVERVMLENTTEAKVRFPVAETITYLENVNEGFREILVSNRKGFIDVTEEFESGFPRSCYKNGRVDPYFVDQMQWFTPLISKRGWLIQANIHVYADCLPHADTEFAQHKSGVFSLVIFEDSKEQLHVYNGR